MSALRSCTGSKAAARTVARGPALRCPARMTVAQPSVVAQSAPAPKTGQHTVEAPLRREALSLFFDNPDELVCTPTSGGVNNVVQYVQLPDGKRYILRVYNNGNNSDKVRFEHLVLAQLCQQKTSFEVPRALPSKAGKAHEQLSNGAEACIFQVIPGTLAKTTSPEEVGRATGELCAAMAKVDRGDMEVPMPPYEKLFLAHWAAKDDSQLIYNEIATNPEFNVCREAIDYLVGEIKIMERKLEEYKKIPNDKLPKQLIHGDLHYDNVMVVGDQVSGLLDFEFCTFDWRAMELAVALSKYVGEDEPLPLIERFVSGYVQHGEVNETEIELMPDFINLRIFSNVVYFTGRALAGEDSLDSLTSRAGTYAKRVRWINANRDAICNTIRAKVQQLAKVAA